MTKSVNISLKKHLIQIIRDNSSFLSPVKTALIPKITKLHNIKCVLFDVYGTLFISGAGDISHSSKRIKKINMNELLSSFHFTALHKEVGYSIEKFFYKSIKLSHQKANETGQKYPEIDVVEIWHSILDRFIRAGKISGSLTDENVKAFALGYEVGKNPVWPMPNLEETLGFIKRKKLLLGLISNAQFFTPLFFEVFLKSNLINLGFRRELLIWSYEYKTAKPSSNLFALVSEILQNQFSVLPYEVLYIGNDILNDIKPASEAGFRTTLFAGDQRSLRTREDIAKCKGIKPDSIITDLLQICDIIQP